MCRDSDKPCPKTLWEGLGETPAPAQQEGALGDTGRWPHTEAPGFRESPLPIPHRNTVEGTPRTVGRPSETPVPA